MNAIRTFLRRILAGWRSRRVAARALRKRLREQRKRDPFIY